MPTTTLSTKGQIVIPKEVRRRQGWVPGSTIELEELDDGVVLRLSHRFPRTTMSDLLGCVTYAGPAKTLEEMDQGIAEGAREHQ
jgi:AbrB family looped-hinge helix DNA binding protein